MNAKNLRTHLTEYYDGQSMPADRVAELASMAAGSVAWTGLDTRTGLSQRRSRMKIAAAAAIGLAAGWIAHALFLGDAPASRKIVESQVQPGQPGGNGQPRNAEAAIPRLVAFAVLADWCPACPVVALVFDELKEEYGDQPIQFVVLDVTTSESRAQAEYLVAGLGLHFVPNEILRRTGAIRVVNRESKTILASLTKPGDVSTLRGALDDALR